MRQFKKNITGQGMTEYIIIVALIAIAAIGVFTGFGDVVKGQVAAIAQELSGADGANAHKLAEEGGKTAEEKAATVGLADYHSGN